MTSRSRRRTRRFIRFLWRRHIRPILLLVLILTSLRSAIADWNDVPSGSMEPSILIGDRIFVNKLAYGLRIPFTNINLFHWSAPKRGDVVVFTSPADGLRLVKRVVGLPGDTIQLIDNRLFINGKPVQYTTIADASSVELPRTERAQHGFATELLGGTKHMVMSTPNISAMRNFGPITVPVDQYFVMGDNRDNSNDSRYIGTVKLDEIVGRSPGVALSLDYDHAYLPRWDRFFKSLDTH